MSKKRQPLTQREKAAIVLVTGYFASPFPLLAAIVVGAKQPDDSIATVGLGMWLDALKSLAGQYATTAYFVLMLAWVVMAVCLFPPASDTVTDAPKKPAAIAPPPEPTLADRLEESRKKVQAVHRQSSKTDDLSQLLSVLEKLVKKVRQLFENDDADTDLDFLEGNLHLLIGNIRGHLTVRTKLDDYSLDAAGLKVQYDETVAAAEGCLALAMAIIRWGHGADLQILEADNAELAKLATLGELGGATDYQLPVAVVQAAADDETAVPTTDQPDIRANQSDKPNQVPEGA